MTEPRRPPVDPAADELPLFLLGTVLFPEGRLALQAFEARYLDLVSSCLRNGRPFGVVALTRGSEVRRRGGAGADEPVGFGEIGTLAHIDEADADQPGLLRIRCHGGARFRIEASRERSDGLWLAHTTLLPPDAPTAPEPALAAAVRALATTIATLKAQFGVQAASRLPSPYRFDDAGWVANRWCELLPLPATTLQRLMALEDPTARLREVDRLLRANGLVEGDAA